MRPCGGDHHYSKVQASSGVPMCDCGKEYEPPERIAYCKRCNVNPLWRRTGRHKMCKPCFEEVFP